jgi:hypothetical protein
MMTVIIMMRMTTMTMADITVHIKLKAQSGIEKERHAGRAAPLYILYIPSMKRGFQNSLIARTAS